MTPLQLGGFIAESIVLIAVIGLLALLAGVGGRIWIERRQNPPLPTIDRTPRSASNEPTESNEITETTHPDTTGATDTSPPREHTPTSTETPPLREDKSGSLLETARDQFSNDEYEETIQAAYMHARNQLAAAYNLESGATPREFFENCHENGMEEGIDELNELTAVYERALFHTETIERHEAYRALELSMNLSADRPDSS